MKSCPWYKRWWHRRLRNADIRYMKPAFEKTINDPLNAAYIQLTGHKPEETATALWDRFINDEGQEHWRCPCAKTEEGQ